MILRVSSGEQNHEKGLGVREAGTVSVERRDGSSGGGGRCHVGGGDIVIFRWEGGSM